MPAASEDSIVRAAPAGVQSADLQTLWREWLAVVNMFARSRRRVKHETDPETYRSVHAALLHGFHSKSAIGDEATRMVYRELHSLMAPWVSLGALERAHRDVIVSLLMGCVELGASVGLRSSTRKAAPLQRIGLPIGLAALAGGLALAAMSDTVSGLISSSTRRLSEEADYYLFRHLTTPAGLALGAAALTLLGIWMVRNLKSA